MFRKAPKIVFECLRLSSDEVRSCGFFRKEKHIFVQSQTVKKCYSTLNSFKGNAVQVPRGSLNFHCVGEITPG